jgi:hypothetical protein
MKFKTILCFALLCGSHSAFPQPNTSEVIRGPVLSGTIRGPKNDAIAMKGIVVTLGQEKKAYICYDTDLMRVSMAWTGMFLDFGNTLNQIAWPPPPQVKGTPLFSTKAVPGWAKAGSFEDPRKNQQGPLPKDQAHYNGLYIHADDVVLKSTLGDVEVLERPGFHQAEEDFGFTRTFQFSKAVADGMLLLADDVAGQVTADFSDSLQVAVNLAGGKALVIGGASVPKGSRIETVDGHLVLKLPKVAANQPFQVILASGEKAARRKVALTDLRTLTKGGPARWTENIVTKGVLGTGKEPYVIDTITEPMRNLYSAKTFFGGFDFFSNGDAAICTFHGDVWVVSGIDDSLEKLTWKRFATGLFQPLGVKVVKDTVYVLGRDQITRLHDVNRDGEADFYENFNNDMIVSANYHEFTLDLHTDRAGNFYFAKGSPWEPAVTTPHQGCLLKVSKDGSKLEVIATGFRAPNGMAVGPRDEITVSDNQGHWMPASKLNWIEKGGFYGMTPAAQRELKLHRDGTNFVANPSNPKVRAALKFKGWDAGSPMPEGYDKPISWLPMNMDNSSGGQVWVTSDKWGPMKDHLLFMSYGRCTLFEVMLNEVQGTRQAAMIQLPLKFNSGIMRGRFNTRDGQLYLCGLKGWQTSATHDGGFYRVRYTGAPVRMPTAFHATQNGAQIIFASPVQSKSAADVANYSVERWNYQWTGAYGSPDFSVSDPTQKRRDKLEVKSARVSSDGKTVFLEIADMKPADQIRIRYSIDDAEGSPLAQEIYATAYKLGPAAAAP